MLVCGNGSSNSTNPCPLNFQWFSARQFIAIRAIPCREMSEELLLPTIVSYSFAVDTCEKAPQLAGHGSRKLMWLLLCVCVCVCVCVNHTGFFLKMMYSPQVYHRRCKGCHPPRGSESSISLQGLHKFWGLEISWGKLHPAGMFASSQRIQEGACTGVSLVWWNGFLASLWIFGWRKMSCWSISMPFSKKSWPNFLYVLATHHLLERDVTYLLGMIASDDFFNNPKA